MSESARDAFSKQASGRLESPLEVIFLPRKEKCAPGRSRSIKIRPGAFTKYTSLTEGDREGCISNHQNMRSCYTCFAGAMLIYRKNVYIIILDMRHVSSHHHRTLATSDLTFLQTGTGSSCSGGPSKGSSG